MVVHLPDVSIVRYGDERWRAERLRAFGARAEAFWNAQERIADLAWDLSARFPALPVDLAGMLALARAARPRHLPLLATLGRTVDSIMPREPSRALRAFVDAQLLITAQTSARSADLAYGCTALDLAREGTFHLAQGVSTISLALTRAFRKAGGAVRYGADTVEIATRRGRVAGVKLADGTIFACPVVVAGLPIQNVGRLCGALERRVRGRVAALPQRYGAFTLYCGLPAGVVPDDLPSHHQLVASYEEALGEGNSTFISFSGARETHRARNGGRAVTLSTHTDVARWERAYRDGGLAELRAAYTARLLAALERVLPGGAARAETLEAADPHTFERYTGAYGGSSAGYRKRPPLRRSVRSAITRRCAGSIYAETRRFPGKAPSARR